MNIINRLIFLPIWILCSIFSFTFASDLLTDLKIDLTAEHNDISNNKKDSLNIEVVPWTWSTTGFMDIFILAKKANGDIRRDFTGLVIIEIDGYPNPDTYDMPNYGIYQFKLSDKWSKILKWLWIRKPWKYKIYIISADDESLLGSTEIVITWKTFKKSLALKYLSKDDKYMEYILFLYAKYGLMIDTNNAEWRLSCDLDMLWKWALQGKINTSVCGKQYVDVLNKISSQLSKKIDFMNKNGILWTMSDLTDQIDNYINKNTFTEKKRFELGLWMFIFSRFDYSFNYDYDLLNLSDASQMRMYNDLKWMIFYNTPEPLHKEIRDIFTKLESSERWLSDNEVKKYFVNIIDIYIKNRLSAEKDKITIETMDQKILPSLCTILHVSESIFPEVCRKIISL